GGAARCAGGCPWAAGNQRAGAADADQREHRLARPCDAARRRAPPRRAPGAAPPLLAALRAAGLVEREPGGQRWQLGLRLVHLGNAALARLDLRDLAPPLLEQLVRANGAAAPPSPS